MRGYQYLENDFFDLCKTRKISRIPMLLYIYLRGLYCRFQKPVFFYFDRHIREHLGISQSTLSRARSTLQEKGLIAFRSGVGINPTQYTMLGTVLLPVVKKTTPSRQNHSPGYRQFNNTYITNKERLKNKVGINNEWQKEAVKAMQARCERKRKESGGV